MKKRSLGTMLVVALGAVTFGACENTVMPVAVDGLSAKKVANGSGPSANGHTNGVFAGALQTFSFHVREAKDGTASGSFQAKSRGQDTAVHGTWDCLRVDGNQAWMSGQITKVNDDNPFSIVVGDAAWVRVTDNGEGAGITDQWSDLWLFNDNDCTSDEPYSFVPGFVPAEVDNEGGNIQVKP